MMAKAKETAEQKLLKMIEVSSDEEASSTGKSPKSSGSGSILPLVQRSNKLLIVGFLCALILFLNEIRTGISGNLPELNISSKSSAYRAKNNSGIIFEPQRESYYIAGISSRNIFEPYEAGSAVQVVESTDESSNFVGKIQSFKLVGISWMDQVNTASVMIEDTTKGTTYFLQKDEKIDDIVVKTIYAESVELGYENEEIIISYD